MLGQNQSLGIKESLMNSGHTEEAGVYPKGQREGLRGP